MTTQMVVQDLHLIDDRIIQLMGHIEKCPLLDRVYCWAQQAEPLSMLSVRHYCSEAAWMRVTTGAPIGAGSAGSQKITTLP